MSEGATFPFTTTNSLLEIIAEIRRGVSHEELIVRLTRGDTIKPNVVQNALDLALRLLLMIDAGGFANAYSGREQDCATWHNGAVDVFLKQIPLFSGIHNSPCADDVKFNAKFNAANLERIAFLEVKLTTNLNDHLILEKNSAPKTVYIFHHATFLQCHQGVNNPFPNGFVVETLWTLALLFPQGDEQVARWFKNKYRRENLDLRVLKSGSIERRLSKYTYWRDRLVDLKEEFDSSEPQTLSQWLYGGRRDAQWWAVWIAVFFTVLFGLIQSIEGALQVYKAFVPSSAPS
ncbi:hypothetical protein NKR23_g12384 [Pleurostoma richardsiae]|uniref:Uncharacterized protein n=1 Tax=Pleurostoma richardsiae TaxID=41990 RepID=A0AA38VIK2_9PEZI|nr:hypothetical protein NKR23_g12384 [Pleurostoma richardsiae]